MNNFLNLIKGPIINCSNYCYNNLRRIWNMAIDKYPFLIIYPIDEDDVINTINYVVTNNIPFRIRNGGHSYEGYSVLNDGVVIDLSYLNQIEINESQNIIIVSGGIKNAELCDALTSYGYPFLGGDCPKVGVSGFALGGGWSYSSRLYGLGCDNLIELQLINYEGKKIIANNYINSDLFWACKGAGQNNFGVITKLIYKLPPKQEMVTLVEITANSLNFNDQIAFFDLWQNYINDLDNHITLSLEFKNKDNIISLYGRVLIYSDYNDAYKLMEPFSKIINGEIKYQTDTFKNIMKQIFIDVPIMEQMKNVGLYCNKIYSSNEISNILSLINEKQPMFTSITLTLYSMGGKIREYKNDSAFYNRDAKYIIALKAYWDNPYYKEDIDSYIYDCYLKLKPLTDGAYINNPYSQLDNYEDAYFGNNLPKLKAIKKAYDPYNYFYYEQSIKI